MVFEPQIDYYTGLCRRGAVDEAFHGLSDLDPAIIPDLEVRFRASSEAGIRVFLLRVISQYRRESTVAVLGEALLDPEPRVWQQALDGLATLACEASVEALRSAKSQRDDEEFRQWIDEAIEQAAADIVGDGQDYC